MRGTLDKELAGGASGTVAATQDNRIPYAKPFQGEVYDLPWGTPGAFAPLPHYQGRYRDTSAQPGTSATSDLEAIAVWLAQKGRRSQHTAKRYRREIERLLLWAANQGRCLSDLGQEDFLRYEKFLENPEPKGRWVMDKRCSRDDPAWRPFRATKDNPSGGLTPQGRHESLAICRGAIHKLQRMNWLLRTEVIGEIQPPEREALDGKEPNALTEKQVEALWKAVAEITNPLDKLRMTWLTELFLTAGPRVAEVVDGVMGSVEMKIVEDRSLWVITLRGKGRRKRTIPLPSPVMKALGDFREALGLPRAPHRAGPDGGIPLAPRIGQRRKPVLPSNVDKIKSMTANGIYKRYQTLFERAAGILSEAGKEVEATKALTATTHDLRHTALKRLADETGGDLRLVQKMAGHRSIGTSAMYARSGLTELEEALMSISNNKR